jgi:hypothetical protein
MNCAARQRVLNQPRSKDSVRFLTRLQRLFSRSHRRDRFHRTSVCPQSGFYKMRRINLRETVPIYSKDQLLGLRHAGIDQIWLQGS